MARASLPLVFALVFSASCTDDTPVSDFELSGFVTDRGTGAGIGNAAVFFQSDTLYQAETTTDGDGFYELIVETDRPFGQVRASAAGYEDEEVSVFFDTPTRRLDVTLRASSGM